MKKDTKGGDTKVSEETEETEAEEDQKDDETI